MPDVTDVPVNKFTDVPVNKFTENTLNKFMENPVNKFTEIITDNIVKLNKDELDELENKKIKNQIFNPYSSRVSEIYEDDFYRTAYPYMPFLNNQKIMNFFKKVKGILWGLMYLPDSSNECKDCIYSSVDDYKRYCVDLKFTRYVYLDGKNKGNRKNNDTKDVKDVKDVKGFVSNLIFHICYNSVIMELNSTHYSDGNNKNNKKIIKSNKKKIDSYSVNELIETWINWNEFENVNGSIEGMGMGLFEKLY